MASHFNQMLEFFSLQKGITVKEKFATAINCIDGRAQVPVVECMKKECNVDYVDMITEPGVDKLLSENKSAIIESIKKKLEISIEYHKSKVIAVVGHQDCAANCASKDNQLDQIQAAVKNVSSWNPKIQVIGLWVSENGEVCEVR